MAVERRVGGDRPRSRRPDDDPAFFRRELFQPEGTRYFSRLGKRKPDVDGKVDAVHVFDFGLGERRAAVEAPVDRFQAPIPIAFPQHLPTPADLTPFPLVPPPLSR